MMLTSLGTMQLKELLESKDIKVKMEYNTTDEKYYKGIPQTGATDYDLENGTLVHKITVYDKMIDKTQNYLVSKNDFLIDKSQYSKEEHIGATGTHESVHVLDKNSASYYNRNATQSEKEIAPNYAAVKFYQELRPMVKMPKNNP